LSEKKYKTPEAFRSAIEARAKKLRDETGEGLDMQPRKLYIVLKYDNYFIKNLPIL